MTDLAGRDWRVLAGAQRPGALNMALDEVAADTAADGGPRTIRVYGWDPSTLSLGYAQDPGTIDWDYCEREGIDVTRRPTGGGAIYHDAVGDVAYTVAVPADEVPGDLSAAYELLCQPVLEALDRLGVPCDFASEASPAIHEPACYLRALDPAHDVVAPDGRKVSGNAQYRQRDAVVQHGSISVFPAVERHLACFTADRDADTFRERVGALSEYADVEREAVIETLADTLAEWFQTERGGAWTDEELARAEALVETKYAADGWVREGDPPDRDASA